MFAVIRSEEGPWDEHAAARVLAPLAGKAPADMVRELGLRPAILLTGLPEPIANQAVTMLGQIGVGARVVPLEALAELPPTIKVRAARLRLEGLEPDEGVLPGGQLFLPWESLHYLDLAQIQQIAMEEVVDWDLKPTYGKQGRKTPEKVVQRMVTTWPSRFTLVADQSRLVLRIDVDDFDFSRTGLQVHSKQQQNLLALAIALVARATAATCGPGLIWAREGRAPALTQRFATEALYEHWLRWRLTVL